MTAELNTDERVEIVTELEQFLEESGREGDADVVSTLIDGDASGVGMDRVAGVPGVELLPLAPLVVDWFLALLRSFLEKLASDSVEEASKGIVARVAGWITGRKTDAKRPRRSADTSRKLETLAEVAKTLEAAGWPRDSVHSAAEDLWRRSEATARKLGRAK